MLRNHIQDKDNGAKPGAVNRANFKLRWREGEEAPIVFDDAVVDSNTVYYKHDFISKMHAYHVPNSSWSSIPECPLLFGFSLTVIDGLLTMVGGYGADCKPTNKLLSLIGEGSGRRWTEKLPPMPTTRCFVSALCTGKALIVAGGLVTII